MNTDLSIMSLVVNASVLVQAVMGLLLVVSFVSWTMIFTKWRVMKKAKIGASEFEEKFWSGGDLNNLYNQVTSGRYVNSGLAVIFEAGFKEYARLRKQDSLDHKAVLEGSQRAMRIAMSKETERLETSLPFLATVGSTSPYVGLFGTVWGIMNSFRALGNVKQATLAMVAPGIAEALIATAMGLFAAIPAVIGYNRYSTDVERLISRYETFIDEFSSILHRQAFR
ncbi:MAG: protein TolQ [Gammaproteobacteria bacterium]|nr:protein TolQ [Gammaproteobacteria bacterium]